MMSTILLPASDLKCFNGSLGTGKRTTVKTKTINCHFLKRKCAKFVRSAECYMLSAPVVYGCVVFVSLARRSPVGSLFVDGCRLMLKRNFQTDVTTGHIWPPSVLINNLICLFAV